MKGIAYVTCIPAENRKDDKHYLCIMGEGRYIRVEVDGPTLCRVTTECAHYLPKFLPGTYAHTPGEITDNTGE